MKSHTNIQPRLEGLAVPDNAFRYNDPRAPVCVVRNLYRSTLGHQEGAPQADGLVQLDEAFAGTDYDYKALMVELAKNPLFRLVDAPK